MSSGPGDEAPHGAPDEEVGSVGEEAARLFGALSDWARDHGSDLGSGLGGGLGGLAGHASAAAREVSEHVDTGASECSWCPVCRTVHLVRATSPEVREHLAVAAASLMQAAAGILAAAGGTQAPRPEPGVEHIDLDDDGPWPEEEHQ
ncbi:hypothetical protein [Nocardioides euryhalodurans]|uniref:Uncharacterized protein n=1 Tax=Nocardioides euryhalodurans TaxID=2518370 RepID=A0A4P7GQT2_9ACTN|nr:hypothetical protein [Nocardioides euryhalodurans]QBR94207.1 hypothetical protein EXE57_19380 [Nocardioides euryhalodurans]